MSGPGNATGSGSTLERFEVRSGDAEDAVTLHVTAAGPQDAPVVVLVHGYPDTSRVWYPLIDELADRYRVVAYDVRGMGGSGAPTTRRGGWRMERLTADFAAVVDEVSPDRPVHLVGHDWGSVQSWAFVTDETTRDRVASFTSISGPSLDLTARWVRRAWRSPRRLGQVLRQGVRSGYIWFFQLPWLPELLWRFGASRVPVAMYATSGVSEPGRHLAHTVRSDATRGVALYRQNVLRRFGRPQPVGDPDEAVPVQIVVPTRDPFLLPALYEDLPAQIPGLVRRDVAAGHWVPLTHPGPLARWIDEHVGSVEDPAAVPSRALRRATQRPDRRPFDDALVLVTGAARGIGRATALAFAELGAELVLADLDKTGLDRTAELADLVGAPATHVRPLDVSDREAVDALAEDLEATVGVPDVVVNNAGVGAAGPFLSTDPDEWERVIGVNLGGVAHGCAAFGPRLPAPGEGGAIVNVASAAAYLPSRATPVYGTSKAAVLALSENLRAELAPHGVGVSAVCPGIVDTRIIDDTTFAGTDDPDAVRDPMVALYRRRAYPPEKVADAIVAAVRADAAVVPVTPEARVAWVAAHLAPGVLRRLARLDPTAAAAATARERS